MRQKASFSAVGKCDQPSVQGRLTGWVMVGELYRSSSSNNTKR